MQTAYMPKNLAAELQNKQLQNQLDQVRLQYAPEMSKAELAN